MKNFQHVKIELQGFGIGNYIQTMVITVKCSDTIAATSSCIGMSLKLMFSKHFNFKAKLMSVNYFAIVSSASGRMLSLYLM